ncbi:MAG: transposase [Planctomycetes bacterium]|nr:transposase [Planctomycetota bacterium]
MSTTSKSPRKVALVALDVGTAALPLYSHLCSPKKFTQPQLFVCLVLKEFFKTDYRGIAGILADSTDLRQAIGLQTVPHFTTLQKAAPRLLRNPRVQQLLDQTVQRARPRGRRPHRPRVKRSAVDSSGFEAHHTSHYFVRRRTKGRKDWQSTTYKRFPKLALLCDCSNHLVLAAIAERGPGPDITHFERIVCQAFPRVRMETLLADAGYDAEWAHGVAREDLGIRTIIPAGIGRPTDKAPKGYYRRLMSRRLHLTCYGQRWQVETAVSMIKRRLGSAVNARSYWSQCRALMLKAIAHNILILYAPTEPSRLAA